MEVEQHRKRLRDIRKHIYFSNKPLRPEVIRQTNRSHYFFKLPSDVHFLLRSNGDVAYRIVSGLSKRLLETEKSNDQNFISEHEDWFGANKGLHRFETFTGKSNNQVWKYPQRPNRSNAGLMDMPLEVFETLVWFLDGYSFNNLCKASPFLETYLNESLNDAQYKTYWETRKNDLEFNFKAKILSSYLQSRSIGESQSQAPLDWQNILHPCVNLDDIIEESTLRLESLRLMEKSIKRDMKIGFLYWFPDRIVMPVGSLLCTIYNDTPNDENNENIFIFKDMNPTKCSRFGTICKKNPIHAVHIMRLEEKRDSVVDLIITVCCRCFCVFPVVQGNVLSVPILDDDDENMPSPVCLHSNIFRNVLGILVTQNCVNLFRISFVGGQVVSEQLHKITLLQFSPLWNNLQSFRNSFMTAVKEIDYPAPMTAEEKDYYETAQIDPPLVKGYGLSIFSFHFGHFLIRPKDAEFLQTVSYSSVCKMSPRYYVEDYDIASSMKCPVGSCSGYGMDIFWSDESLAVSFDSVTWHLKSFYDGARLFSRPPDLYPNESTLPNIHFVVAITVCAPGLILAAMDRHLTFIRLKLDIGRDRNGHAKRYPRITWDVLRRIDFDLQPLNLTLHTLYFDFEDGEPYIFAELRDYLNLANPLKFQLKKILLHYKEVKNDSGYLSINEGRYCISK